MSKGIKIFIIIMASLGVISLVFLLVTKKKTQPVSSQPVANANQNVAATGGLLNRKTAPKTTTQKSSSAKKAPATKKSSSSNASVVEQNQWNQCKNKTMPISTNLFWSIKVSESIPNGGTYAKGTLRGDSAYSIQIIIKSGINNSDQLKQRLAVGKTVFMRGNCTDVATDGAVVLQAF